MKFMLTIETTDAEALAALLASVSGTSINISSSATTSADDDDDAPDAAAPATDKEGLPWDARIHSSSKKIGADGTWNRKRNTHDTTWNTVRAELFAARAAAPTTTAAPPPPPMSAQPGIIPPPVGDNTAAPPPPPVTTAVVPPPPPVATGMQFGEFMAKYSAAMASGKVTQPDLQSYLTSLGLADLSALNSAGPEMVQKLHDWMAGNGKL